MGLNTDHPPTQAPESEKPPRLYRYATVLQTTVYDPVNCFPEGTVRIKPGIIHDGADYEVYINRDTFTVTTETVAVLVLPEPMTEDKAIEAGRQQARKVADGVSQTFDSR